MVGETRQRRQAVNKAEDLRYQTSSLKCFSGIVFRNAGFFCGDSDVDTYLNRPAANERLYWDQLQGYAQIVRLPARNPFLGQLPEQGGRLESDIKFSSGIDP